MASPTAQARAPLPAPGTPLKQTMSELQARAAAGDAEAASRLYHDTQRCAQFRRMKVSAPRIAEMALGGTDKKSNLSPKDSAVFLDIAQKQLDFIRDNAIFCSDLNDDDIDPIFLPSALQAALLGDAAAADCYVSGGGTFGFPPGLLEHPEWLTDFKQNAIAIANAAIEKGDWIMVSQIANAYDGMMPSLLQQAAGPDKALAFRYYKLSRIGAQGDGNGLQYLAGRLSALAKDIPSNAKAAADAWAQDAYQRYFSKNPQNTAYKNYRVCDACGL